MWVRTMAWIGLGLLVVAWPLLGSGCSDNNNLPAVDGGEDGEADGDDGGDGGEELEYPVRVVFVVDSSGSTQATDEDGRRIQALTSFITARADDPAYAFSIIEFDTIATVLTDGFERLDGDDLPVFGSDGLADVQGGLIEAHQVLAAEMQATVDEAERGRTRYAVVLLADGVPTPICRVCVDDPPDDPIYSANCHPDLQLACKMGIMPDFEGECPGGLCGEPDQSPAVDIDNLPAGFRDRLEAGVDYNDRPELLALAEALDELGQQQGAGAMALHTVYLDCFEEQGTPLTAVCEAAIPVIGLQYLWARALYEDLAAAGGGAYVRAPVGTAIDLEQLQLEPLGP